MGDGLLIYYTIILLSLLLLITVIYLFKLLQSSIIYLKVINIKYIKYKIEMKWKKEWEKNTLTYLLT